jgi:chemotaxis protein MotB
MSRKAKPASHENHERWMVSYADFMTLMFALFVVMFASSQSDKGHAKQVSDSVKKALEEGQVAAAIASMVYGKPASKPPYSAATAGGPAKVSGSTPQASAQTFAELLPSLQQLTTELKQDISSGKLQVRLEARGLIVSLTEAAFFNSGEADILPAAFPSIEKVANVIKKLPNPVRLEGHTDSIPIHNSRFRSNWELSSARAIAMLELLKGRCGVPERQLAVGGYADTSPVDTNDTEEGRAHNRRVNIVILGKGGFAAEPQGPEPAQKPAAAQDPSAAPKPAAKHA